GVPDARKRPSAPDGLSAPRGTVRCPLCPQVFAFSAVETHSRARPEADAPELVADGRERRGGRLGEELDVVGAHQRQSDLALRERVVVDAGQLPALLSSLRGRPEAAGGPLDASA